MDAIKELELSLANVQDAGKQLAHAEKPPAFPGVKVGATVCQGLRAYLRRSLVKALADLDALEGKAPAPTTEQLQREAITEAYAYLYGYAWPKAVEDCLRRLAAKVPA